MNGQNFKIKKFVHIVQLGGGGAGGGGLFKVHKCMFKIECDKYAL